MPRVKLGLSLSPVAWYEFLPMIRFLLFDLDNTLYPSSNPMESEIVNRMNEYTARFLGLSVEEAVERRRAEMPRHGTTLEWLMADYGFDDPENYLAAVHPEGEEECIDPDPDLGRFLDALPYPKFVFTNSTREHADRVLRRLGFPEVFQDIFDIRFNQFKGKPHPTAGLRVCSVLGVKPSETLLVDDLPRYVRGYLECGGNGVLLDDRNRHPDYDKVRIASLYDLPAVLSDGPLGAPEQSGFES